MQSVFDSWLNPFLNFFYTNYSLRYISLFLSLHSCLIQVQMQNCCLLFSSWTNTTDSKRFSKLFFSQVEVIKISILLLTNRATFRKRMAQSQDCQDKQKLLITESSQNGVHVLIIKVSSASGRWWKENLEQGHAVCSRTLTIYDEAKTMEQ